MFQEKRTVSSVTEEADIEVTVAIDSFQRKSFINGGRECRSNRYPACLSERFGRGASLADGGEGDVSALAAE